MVVDSTLAWAIRQRNRLIIHRYLSLDNAHSAKHGEYKPEAQASEARRSFAGLRFGLVMSNQMEPRTTVRVWKLRYSISPQEMKTLANS